MTRKRLRRVVTLLAGVLVAQAILTWGIPTVPPVAISGFEQDSSDGELGPGSPGFDPVKVTASVEPTAVDPGGEVLVTVTAKMVPGWHINSHKPLEEWLIPTEVFFDSTGYYQVVEVVYPQEKVLKFEFSDEDVAVYEKTANILAKLEFTQAVNAGELVINGLLGYQSCDDKTCMAPTTKPFSVQVNVQSAGSEADAAGGSVGSTGDDGGEGGVQSRLTSSLGRHFGNPILAILLTLLAGLLSAATPCVYPMIPITARILMGRGGDNPALGRLHAFMYFLGIILVYALLGIIAGVTGGGFNEIMRIPQVILLFALLFFYLGLSMLGFFEIQIPDSFASKVDSSTSQRSGLVGTMLMGAGAGLVVSPCVGPVVIFILTQIAAQMATIEAAGGGTFGTTGKVLYGGYLMAGYGAGLGVPFLLVGIFSARLAQPGGWMTFVRMALGVVILYFAYDYYQKAMSTAGVERGFADAILTGVILIFLAVLWGVFKFKIEDGPHAGWQKIRLASTIVMLVMGVFFLWTGLNRSGLVPGGETAISSGGVVAMAGPVEEVERTGTLTWQRDFATAQQMAREQGKPIFVDFYAHWCANCKKFSHQAAQPGPLQDALQRVVAAKVYDTDEVFAAFKADTRYPELKRGLPFFLILSSDGEFLWKGADYQAHDTMINEIGKAILLEG